MHSIAVEKDALCAGERESGREELTQRHEETETRRRIELTRRRGKSWPERGDAARRGGRRAGGRTSLDAIDVIR